MYKGKFLGHKPCPKCGKNDNLAVWYIEELDAEQYYCFTPGCGHQKTTAQLFSEAGLPIPAKYTCSEIVPYSLPDGCKPFDKWCRDVPPEVYQQYGIVLFEGMPVFPYWDRFNSHWIMSGAKFSRPRDDPRGRYWFDGTMPQHFFGQHISDSPTLVITEGEYDAVAVRYATGFSTWSVNSGASSAPGLVEANLKELDEFKKVVFFLDNDKQGISATMKCLKILESGYWAVPPDGLKDASDVIRKLGVSGLMDVVDQATLNEPDFIVKDVKASIKHRILSVNSKSRSTGLPKLDKCLGGWRPGELTILLAETSKGKSTLSRWFAAQQMHQGQNIAYIALEDGFATGGIKLIESYFGTRYVTGNVPGSIDEDLLDRRIEAVSEKALIVDNVNTLDELQRVVKYAVQRRSVSFVVLDHLTALAFKSTGKALTDVIPQIMTTLRELALKYECHILAISHTRRMGYGEKLTVSSGYGSNSIETVADNVLILNRVRDPVDKLTLELSKCRAWGVSGDNTIGLCFNYEKQAYESL
jgi:KaiC/GvpD/RAD55 family RecA-like ATPase/Zn ribbon nucleic-acid-binding protein